MDKNNFVDVVILNYNGFEDTIECINSILESSYKEVNILIVDNCSTNDSIKKIEDYLKNESKNKYDYYFIKHNSKNNSFNKEKIYNLDNRKIFLISNDENGGFGKGNNIAFKFSNLYLNSKFCWILNNDVIIERNAISNMIEYIKEKKAFIGSTIIEYYNRELIQRIGGNAYYPILGKIKSYNKGKLISELNNLEPKYDYLSGCSIFTEYKYLNMIGGFDERFFLYAEDIDLCFEAKKIGIELLWCKNSYVYHKCGKSIGSKNIISERSVFSEYNSNYSMLVFNKKWFKMHKLYSFNRYILKCIKFIVRKEFNMFKPLNQAYKDFYKERKKDEKR